MLGNCRKVLRYKLKDQAFVLVYKTTRAVLEVSDIFQSMQPKYREIQSLSVIQFQWLNLAKILKNVFINNNLPSLRVKRKTAHQI